MKLTKWFDGNKLPFHVGYYERDYMGTAHICFFDGKNFRTADVIIENFIISKPIITISICQDLPWRGLKAKP